MRHGFVVPDVPLNEREQAKTQVRLWHDDIRRPPRGWMWARTNDEAQRILTDYNVIEVSLDHDLGLHEEDPDTTGAIYMAGSGETTGLDLVRWMIDNGRVPASLRIHSMNITCAMRMAYAFQDAGYPSLVEPYTVAQPEMLSV